ncbi:MAG: hypothetical protein EOO68_13420 [Moraxellaceae bacterium]|nr:MAG: hypothetical protein EOO68_13420 [Moraxellaceae bacterium]
MSNPYAVAGITTPENKQAWGFSGTAENITMTSDKGLDIGVTSAATTIEDVAPSESRKNGGGTKTAKE